MPASEQRQATRYQMVTGLLPTGLLRFLRRKKHQLTLIAYHRQLAAQRAAGREIVHFLHIGKTAGTALKHALSKAELPDRFMIELHDHEFLLPDIPAGDKVIFALRDPVSRFISGFHSRQREGRPRHFIPWTRDERKAFTRFPSPEDLARAITADDHATRREARRAMHSIQHVYSPYSEWLRSIEYVIRREADILFVAFQESLSADIENLNSVLPLASPIHLPDDPVKSHRTPSSSTQTMGEEARRNIREWYAGDYAFLAHFKKRFQSPAPQGVAADGGTGDPTRRP